nr:topless-related protein 3-like isoform X2 [Ipomoea batatas]
MWEFTKIIDQVQCQVVSMPECSDAKVARLLYTNSGVGILALSSNGIKKLWKWPNNEQNPTEKATANSIPQHWQPNSGHDVSGINLEKVVPCIALSYDDSHIVSAVGGNVSLFNSMTFKVLTTFRAPSTPTFLVFYPGDNDIIAIGMEDATIIIYNVRLDKIKTKLIKGHHKHITGLAFSTTGPNILVSSSADARLCVWDIVGRSWQNRRLVRIQSPDGEVCSGDTHVMFHTVRLHLLLVTHETQLAIYDTSNMERKCQWTPQGCLSARISSATYSCNRKLVYASFIDGNIGVLDADNLTLRCRIAPSAYLSQPILNSEGIVYAVAIAAHPQAPNQLAIGLTDGSIKVIEPLEPEGEWGMSPPIDTEILNGTGEAEQREPNLANEDCEPEEISVRTQIEPGTVEVEQVEPNPVNEDCEPEEISVHTQIELGTVEVEQVEPNPVNEDCEPEEISVRTQIELGTVEVEQVEPNPVNEDCEPEEISVRTEIELGTVEVEQVEPNPASEDCEAAKKSVLTQLEQGTGEAEQTEPNPSNEDCEPDERSVVTQPELVFLEMLLMSCFTGHSETWVMLVPFEACLEYIGCIFAMEFARCFALKCG